jgi:hypothetical protein
MLQETIADSLSDIALSLRNMMLSNGHMTEAEKSKMAARVKTVAMKIVETISNIMMAVELSSTSCENSAAFNETNVNNLFVYKNLAFW